ncbi:helix-turn-helix domain-containing protein [Actinomadura parmotrematis]|uniref:TetR/AcrR family transcriptional regulator n=1 Tax=Actinomadura parmotrematis TaxID=2864039 RepID=A0ABS7FTP8_9ACTN|nr:TetR/AcrR family transcriptional regulator [Actinomadura parmotrematis]MBW8483785.1 TetR/AcrR family transcriptional regulator [Actinomadura parmotrematis]
MGRWEPNARERLERAALDLFVEHGYDATTVAAIAERAGLTKSTFFRHFADKREVLFGAPDLLADLLAGAIAAAPPPAPPAACLAAALDAAAAASFTAERRGLARQRRAVVASSSELRERELLKLSRVAAAMAAAFRARGTGDTTARLAAEIGVLAFGLAFESWTEEGNARPFTDIAHETLRDLQASAAALGA